MRRFWRVYSAMREQTTLTFAKIATMGGFGDIDCMVIKATSPDDLPLSDKYIHELQNIFSISPSSFRAFSLSFTCRFGKTHSWKVALKCLLLLHRLLRSTPNITPFHSELLWNRSNGLLSLYPCHFRDNSSSSDDFTLFIRSYARLLDEVLDCVLLENSRYLERDLVNINNEMSDTMSDTMKRVGNVLELLPQLQSLIDRVIDCRPRGVAARNFIVKSAMKQVIRDSFLCYTTFRKEVGIVLDNLLHLPYRSCVEAFGVYKKAAIQASQLSEFYEWCKAMGVCGAYEYPFIDKIPSIQVQALESFLHGMWQMTESSSTTTVSPPSSSQLQSPSSFTESEGHDDTRFKIVPSKGWEKFHEEIEPLLTWFEDDIDDKNNDNVSWEVLLDGYTSLPSFYGNGNEKSRGEEKDCWKFQVYNPIIEGYNPFDQPQNGSLINALVIMTP
ncbi:AP180 N-terminal homology (ANTH) domain [Dillenia turbinata]|uniref:AP180 N-terminal homology (ANTH) domain n=1 Tax=Dillenia turbinata TaxID=194707 RepID=A0AAN8UQX1_9MAGN